LKIPVCLTRTVCLPEDVHVMYRRAYRVTQGVVVYSNATAVQVGVVKWVIREVGSRRKWCVKRCETFRRIPIAPRVSPVVW